MLKSRRSERQDTSRHPVPALAKKKTREQSPIKTHGLEENYVMADGAPHKTRAQAKYSQEQPTEKGAKAITEIAALCS